PTLREPLLGKLALGPPPAGSAALAVARIGRMESRLRSAQREAPIEQHRKRSDSPSGLARTLRSARVHPENCASWYIRSVPMSLSERLRAHVEYLSQTIGERHFRKPEALAHAVSYIGRQLAEMGVEVVEQAFEVNGQRFVNLEIVIPRASTGGPDPGCIVVGAHYDTVIGTPGAEDNASGVAALLEMVRKLAGERPERTISVRPKIMEMESMETPWKRGV